MTKIFFDTEFIDDGYSIELLSIGMINDDGGEYYAEVSGVDYNRAAPWVRQNVMPHFIGPQKSRDEIAEDIKIFVGKRPEFWAYFSAYDWVVLCQLYGRMIDVPDSWPMYCHDLRILMNTNGVGKSPIDNKTVHNALEDARWVRNTYNWMGRATKTIL